VLHVTHTLAPDADLPASACWEPILCVADERARYGETHGDGDEPDGERVQYYMTFHRDNPVSLVQSIAHARENARSIREVVSLEVWQTINELYLWITGASGAGAADHASGAGAASSAERAFREDRYGFYRRVRQMTELTVGLLSSTMLHDTPLDFILLGVVLERASQTARTLDMHHYITRDELKGHLVVETALFLSLLRACSGFEPFMKRNQGKVSAPAALAFLLLEPSFPRSVRYCITEAGERLLSIRSPVVPGQPGVAAQDMLRLLEEWLIEMPKGSLKRESIHGVLEHVVEGIDRVCDKISQEFLGRAPAAERTRAATQ
jgi:uncharacterized alpha-E superfamily protein